MLSDQEQRTWEEIQRFWAETADEPAAVRRAAASLRRQARRERGDVPGWVIIATRVAMVTVLLGAVTAGLALGAATLLGWALWRYWPRTATPNVAAPTSCMSGEVDHADEVLRGSAAIVWRGPPSSRWEDDR